MGLMKMVVRMVKKLMVMATGTLAVVKVSLRMMLLMDLVLILIDSME